MLLGLKKQKPQDPKRISGETVVCPLLADCGSKGAQALKSSGSRAPQATSLPLLNSSTGWAAALEFSRYVLKSFFAPSLLQTLNSKAKPGASGEQGVTWSLGKHRQSPADRLFSLGEDELWCPPGQTSQ